MAWHIFNILSCLDKSFYNFFEPAEHGQAPILVCVWSWSNKNTVNQRLNRSPTKITSSSLIWRVKSSLGWRLWRNGMILEYLTVLSGAKDRENEAGMHCCRYFWKEKYLLLLLTSILIILNKRIFPEILCFLWNFWCPFT